jgi:hypothetical protein
MRRGPGHVERKIAEIFEANPDKAFAAGTLCLKVWPGANRIEHKHRVSVIRAASRIAEKIKWTRTKFPDWCTCAGIVVFVGPKAEEIAEGFAAANRYRCPENLIGAFADDFPKPPIVELNVARGCKWYQAQHIAEG